MALAPKFNADRVMLSELWLDITSFMGSPIDFYVNAVTGDDANDGLTPATALKTPFAVAYKTPALPPPSMIIHLAPGTYPNTPISLFGGGWTMVGDEWFEDFTGTPNSVVVANREMTFLPDPTWAPDVHKGKLLYIAAYVPGGTPIGNGYACVPIISNTNDTLTLAAPAGWVNTMNEVKIVRPKAVIMDDGSFGGLNSSGCQIAMLDYDSSTSMSGGSVNNNGGTFYGCRIKGQVNAGISSSFMGCRVYDFSNWNFPEYGQVLATSMEFNFPPAGFSFSRGLSWENVNAYSASGTYYIQFYKSNMQGFMRNRCYLDGVGIHIQDYAVMDTNDDGNGGVSINNFTGGDAIVVSNASINAYGVLQGGGNSSMGLSARNGSQVKVAAVGNTLTGAGGDFNVDGVAANLWAAVPVTNPAEFSRVYI